MSFFCQDYVKLTKTISKKSGVGEYVISMIRFRFIEILKLYLLNINLTGSGLALATDLGDAVLFQQNVFELGSALSHIESHELLLVHLKVKG